jgi:hypothetical protein
VLVDQLVRYRGATPAKALVRFLQCNDVGIQLVEHVENALGIAPAIGADRFSDVVAGDGDRRRSGHNCGKPGAGSASSLDVQVRDAEGVFLDELAPRFDDVAHEPSEDLVGDVRLRDLDPQ